jgi:Protein of unknown function (DUF3429)
MYRMSQSTLLRLLPYAGTLPFIYGVASRFSDSLSALVYLVFFIDVRHMVLSYGLLIISFMAGVHWGQYLSGLRPRLNLLVSSNAVALLTWFCYLKLQPFELLLVFAGIFAVIYLIDLQMRLDGSYMQTRRNVTAIVCSCLLVIAFV